MNRFVWDFSALSSGGPLAPPGRYTVQMMLDGKTYARSLTVRRDPRGRASDADLQEQYRFVLPMLDLSGAVSAALKEAACIENTYPGKYNGVIDPIAGVPYRTPDDPYGAAGDELHDLELFRRCAPWADRICRERRWATDPARALRLADRGGGCAGGVDQMAGGGRSARVSLATFERFELVERARPVGARAGAIGRDRPAPCRRSGTPRNSSSRCRRSGCAGPARRSAGTARRSGRAPPSPGETRSPSRETRPRLRRAAGRSKGCSVSRVAAKSRSHSSRRELLRHRDRRQLRGVQDLVGIGVADAAHDARIGERALEGVVLRAERGAERVELAARAHRCRRDRARRRPASPRSTCSDARRFDRLR